VNKEEPFRDQAERLRKKIEILNEVPSKDTALPSRSNLHRNKKNKTKWKLKYPVIRLLALFFIILPIVIFSAHSYLGSNKIISTEKVSNEKTGYEEINLEDKQFDVIDKADDDSTEQQEAEVDTEQGNETNSNEEIDTNPEGEGLSSEDPDELSQSVDLPSTDKDQTITIPKEESSSEMVYHTVESSETLYRIAMKYYQSQAGIEIIKKANHIVGNEIKAGQVLKIPK
jgi:LysM repeat protein